MSNYPYISKFDDDDYYAPNYLTDILNAFKYTEADVVGKLTVYGYLEKNNSLIIRYPNYEHQYVSFVAGSTLTIRKDIFNKLKFPHVSKGEDTGFLSKCKQKGIKVYSTDRFNHVVIRRPNITSHSWQISEEHFMKNSRIVTTTKNYKSIITI